MSRYIKVDELKEKAKYWIADDDGHVLGDFLKCAEIPSIDIVRCEDCRKSHIDGKTTHHLWCTEWGRSTDPFGYCERGEREGE